MEVKNSSYEHEYSLFDVCNYNANIDEKDYFVGIQYDDKQLKINFPLGYRKARTEQELKKDILTLIKVLSLFNTENIAYITKETGKNQDAVQFPIHAYLYVIRDFLNNGYYVEKEIYFKQGTSGKINWNKTIKQIKPTLNEDNVVYLKYITRRTNYNENELISQIHRWCVYESFEKIGWIFSSYKPTKPTLNFNKKQFLAVLNQKKSQTFNEKAITLFNYMLDIIEQIDKNNGNQNFFYGTENFAYIWECMVDNAFGVKNKQKYYPHIYWDIEGKTYTSDETEYSKSALRPDSIMILNEKTPEQELFVLDSKYYRYGITKIPSHLPMSGSIIKQIAYAQFIDKKEDEGKLDKSKTIYNAFILPYEANNEDETINYIGTATTDYTINDKPYNKIKAILIDTKYLMSHYIKNDEWCKLLGDKIKE